MSKLETINPNKPSPALKHTPIELEQPKVENTHKAFAIYRDPKDTKFVLVEVAFNPTSSNVTELTRDVREDVIDRLKMTIADNFFGDI